MFLLLNHSSIHSMMIMRRQPLISQDKSLGPQEPATMSIALLKIQEKQRGQRMCNWSWSTEPNKPTDLSDWRRRACSLTKNLKCPLMSNFQNLLVRRILHSCLYTAMTKSNLAMRSQWPSRSNWRTTKLKVPISISSLKRLSSHWMKPMEILSMSIRMRRRRQMKSTNLTSRSIRGKCWMIMQVRTQMKLRPIHNPRRSSTNCSKMRMIRRWNLPLSRQLLETGLKTAHVKTGCINRSGKFKGTLSINK